MLAIYGFHSENKLYIKKTAILNHFFPYKKCVTDKKT
jgi:hypothetical protein